ncbi:MAG TPA: DoxX family protein [Aestuariivirgaceae bacterium]|nr:DoxX family protein [Aestuariivirgaceae bacterium]
MGASANSKLIFPALGQVYAAVDEWTLPLLRLLAGLSMAMHGWVHIRGDMAQTAAYFASEGYAPGLFWAWAVTLTELVGGTCLAIGFLTRLVAVPILVFLITAVFYHMRNGFFWNEGGFEYPLMWAAVVLVFLVKGGGRVSLDSLLGKNF